MRSWAAGANSGALQRAQPNLHRNRLTKVAFALLIFPFFLGAITLLMWQETQRDSELADHGVQGTATVLALDAREGMLTYRLTVNGRVYEARNAPLCADPSKISVGSQIPVTYSSQHPNINSTCDAATDLLGDRLLVWVPAIGFTVVAVISREVDRRWKALRPDPWSRGGSTAATSPPTPITDTARARARWTLAWLAASNAGIAIILWGLPNRWILMTAGACLSMGSLATVLRRGDQSAQRPPAALGGLSALARTTGWPLPAIWAVHGLIFLTALTAIVRIAART